MRLVILLGLTNIGAASCQTEPQIDVGNYEGELMLHMYPVNQPGKPEWDRQISHGDMCVNSDDYSKISIHHREMHQKLEEYEAKAYGN